MDAISGWTRVSMIFKKKRECEWDIVNVTRKCFVEYFKDIL